MEPQKHTRREFLQKTLKITGGVAVGSLAANSFGRNSSLDKPVVSIVKIKKDKVDGAIEEALDLIGSIETITKGKEQIMLKPNLVAEGPDFTTKPKVIKTLAQLMKKVGKDVLIGEGSAAASGFNVRGGETFRTRNQKLLDDMQQYVYDQLDYTKLAQSLKIPLINLHSGKMVDIKVPDALVFDNITLHHSLSEIDLLCSVPMMKTHVFAHVTLGMKNLIGLYPGTMYQSVRWMVHDLASKVEPSGTAVAIVDMVRANKLGLTVIDGSMAMEGDGPTEGSLVKMDVIIAGTNPLATDMVASAVMGFNPSEIPTFTWANKSGLKPTSLDEIEIRGEKLEKVKRNFKRPNIYTWENVRDVWGAKEI